MKPETTDSRNLMRIYISGPITNNPDYKYDFDRAAKKLRQEGMSCWNPAAGDEDPNKTWSDYMREDLAALLRCRAIFMLKGWRFSKGARLERKVAKALGYMIMYER